VTNSSFTDENLQLIVAGLKQRLGQEVIVRIDRVEYIPKEASGKYRYIISRVTAPNF